MTGVRDSPHFSFIPATETDITEVFELFDELDSWLECEVPDVMRWVNSGMAVRFDEDFRVMLALAREEDDFQGFLEYHEHRQAMIDNMDYCPALTAIRIT